MAQKVKYNFKRSTCSQIVGYVDLDATASLKIIRSGWDGLYHCIIEWGDTSDVTYNLYYKEQIKEKYGVEI